MYFAQYWGQEVMYRKFTYVDGSSKLSGPYEIINLDLIDHKLGNQNGVVNQYLKLKRLSNITEEDALEVAKIEEILEPKFDTRDFHQIYSAIPYNNHFIHFHDDFEKCSVDVLEDNGTGQEFFVEQPLKLASADYLRKKGYAVSYDGMKNKDLIKRDWLELID